MRRYFGILSVGVLFLVAACLPATAGSINSFSGVTLQGVSNTTVSGTFSVNSTGLFSNISISFTGNSIFGGVNAVDSKSIQGIYIQGKGWWFSWWTKVGGNWICYSVLFNPNNPNTNQFWTGGLIVNGQNRGGYQYLEVPEGGAILSYLFLSGAAVFAGIAMSAKQRRQHAYSPVGS